MRLPIGQWDGIRNAQIVTNIKSRLPEYIVIETCIYYLVGELMRDEVYSVGKIQFE